MDRLTWEEKIADYMALSKEELVAELGVEQPSEDRIRELVRRMSAINAQLDGLIAKHLSGPGSHPVERQVVEGSSAAKVICSTARSGNFDMIVICSHGRSGVVRLVLGSIAEKVLREAPCPVLTYKQPNERTAKAE